jgi:pterin-4a-carbinolamine dehydratase
MVDYVFLALTNHQHHARVTVDYANVYISAHTHVAYQRTSSADTDTKPIKVPGLTARDIRFAVKVERLHERFLGDEHAVTKVPVDFASLQAWSMEQLRRRYPDTGRMNIS